MYTATLSAFLVTGTILNRVKADILK